MWIPVSIASDLTSGWNAHVVDAYAPPTPDFFDSSAPMDWVIGKHMGKHSFAPTVLHKGQPIVLDGHDLGPLLQHAPCNAFQHQIKSSRKTIFSASTVLATKKPIACVDDAHPMMLCGDIGLPQGFNDTNSQHTVFVGMTALDVFKGEVEIYKTAIADFATGAWNAPGAVAPNPGDVVKDLTGTDEKKMVVNAVASLAASIAVSHESGWKEPITLKFDGGGGFGSQSTEYSFNPESGQVSRKDTQNVLGMKQEREISGDGINHRSNDQPGGEMRDGSPSWGPIL